MPLDVFVLNLLNGISLGSVLFLLAASLSLIIGVMGILNLAHGALYMVGAFVGWTVAVQYELNFGLAALMGGLAAGLVGLIIERGLFRRLYKQLNEQVLLSFGLIYILTNLSQWVWGPRDRAPFTAPLWAGSFDIMGWSYPYSRVSIIFIGLILAAGLWWLQDKTRVGAIVRAGMDDAEMTSGLGINLTPITVGASFLGSALAGFAGVAGTPLLGQINLEAGLTMLLVALAVCVIGGVGSIQGAMVGALLIGIATALAATYLPVLAMFMMYIAMVLILVLRPSGLLGRKF